jgi:hypothetical protein
MSLFGYFSNNSKTTTTPKPIEKTKLSPREDEIIEILLKDNQIENLPTLTTYIIRKMNKEYNNKFYSLSMMKAISYLIRFAINKLSRDNSINNRDKTINMLTETIQNILSNYFISVETKKLKLTDVSFYGVSDLVNIQSFNNNKLAINHAYIGIKYLNLLREYIPCFCYIYDIYKCGGNLGHNNYCSDVGDNIYVIAESITNKSSKKKLDDGESILTISGQSFMKTADNKNDYNSLHTCRLDDFISLGDEMIFIQSLYILIYSLHLAYNVNVKNFKLVKGNYFNKNLDENKIMFRELPEKTSININDRYISLSYLPILFNYTTCEIENSIPKSNKIFPLINDFEKTNQDKLLGYSKYNNFYDLSPSPSQTPSPSLSPLSSRSQSSQTNNDKKRNINLEIKEFTKVYVSEIISVNLFLKLDKLTNIATLINDKIKETSKFNDFYLIFNNVYPNIFLNKPLTNHISCKERLCPSEMESIKILTHNDEQVKMIANKINRYRYLLEVNFNKLNITPDNLQKFENNFSSDIYLNNAIEISKINVIKYNYYNYVEKIPREYKKEISIIDAIKEIYEINIKINGYITRLSINFKFIKQITTWKELYNNIIVSLYSEKYINLIIKQLPDIVKIFSKYEISSSYLDSNTDYNFLNYLKSNANYNLVKFQNNPGEFQNNLVKENSPSPMLLTKMFEIIWEFTVNKNVSTYYQNLLLDSGFINVLTSNKNKKQNLNLILEDDDYEIIDDDNLNDIEILPKFNIEKNSKLPYEIKVKPKISSSLKFPPI